MKPSSSSRRQEFVAEAEDILEEATGKLLEIQDAMPGEPDPDSVNALFRAMHTMKGMSGLFGFQGLADMSHALENVLDMVRLGKAELNDKTIGFMFDSIDALRSVLVSIKNGHEENTEDISAYLAEIEAFVDSLSRKESSVEPGLEAFADIMGVLSEYEEHRLKTNLKSGKGMYMVSRVFPLETFDTDLKELTEKIKAAGELISTMPTSEGVAEGHIGFNLLVGVPLGKAEFEAHIGGECREMAAIKSARKGPAPVVRAQKAEEAEPSLKTSTDTLRVDIGKIDRILNAIGELSLVRSSIRGIWADMVEQNGNTPATIEIYRVAQTVDMKIAELQALVLDIRMVPVGQIFSRLGQVIRRYSKRVGKQITLNVYGEDAEIDKAIAEEVADPLMHIVRNAIDHGIESGQQRLRLGKPDAGTVSLHAYQRGNNVIIEVRDDGSGIDAEKVRAKAVAKGLVEEGAELTKQEAYDLIFMPGFSTAESVSETSGRGVGLDVVKSKIGALGGYVEIKSEAGAGTTFIITLPITLALIKALTVRAGGQMFCVPLSSMSETFMVEQGRADGGRSTIFRGAPLPLFSLSELLGLPEAASQRKPAIVIGHGERRMGLVVDELVRQTEIIIKPLSAYFEGLKGFAGAAEVGQSQIVLVLDIEGVIEDAMATRKAAAQA